MIVLVIISLFLTLRGSDAACSTSEVLQATTCITTATSAAQHATQDLNTDALTQACQVIEGSVTCVDNKLGQCYQYYTLVQTVHNLQDTLCNDATHCLAAFFTCNKEHPGVNLSALTMNPSPDFCQEVLPFISCTQSAMDPACAVVPSLSDYQAVWEHIEFACQQTTCESVQHCQTTFREASGTVSQLNYDTCMAYRDYSECLNTALPDCQDYQQRSHEPSPATIATYVAEGCTLMSEARNIYPCTHFTDCFNDFMASVYELSPMELCNVVQGTMGCAASNAQACGVQNHQQFIARSNNFMLHIANHGCGLPKLELASCDGFHACANAMAANISVPQGYFLDICSTISTFQQCAGDMMASCSLEDHVLPSLHQLSVLTRRTCTAIKHQRPENCTEFMQCLSNTRVPPLDGASLSSFQWCNLTLAILQCAKTYSSQCNFTSSGRVTLLDIYTDALSQGCTNVYSLRVTTSENGADNVRGWFTLLFATLVCVWAFLDTHEGLYI